MFPEPAGLHPGSEQRRVNLLQQPPPKSAGQPRPQQSTGQRVMPPDGLEQALARTGYDLNSLNSLKELGITGAGMRVEVWSELPLLLSKMPNLMALDLSRNALGLEWAGVLARGLVQTPLLRALRLNSCSIIELGLPAGLPGPPARSAFEEALQATPQLEILQLAGNQLAAGASVALAAAVRRVPKLKELALQQNRFGPEGARQLLPLLQWTPGLKELQLGRNYIGIDGVMALTEALPHLPELEVLGLECNELGLEGAECLSKALMRHRVLVSLDMSWNDLGLEGVRALAKPLQLSSQLFKLRLGGNGLDPSAERELMSALVRTRSPAIGVL